MAWALLAATPAGVLRAAEEGGAWRAEVVHPRNCTSVAVAGRAAYAGAHGGGVARSLDGGRAWEPVGLDDLDVTAVAASGALVVAGTRPTAVYRSDDSGGSWRELDAFRDIRSRRLWFFPGGPPFTAYVSDVAIAGEVIVVGIEFGAVVRSPDGGSTWEDHRPGALRDCHELAISPDGSVFEAGGNSGGAAVSRNAGETWERTPLEKGRAYAVSVAANGERWYVASSPSPWKAHGQRPADAKIYRRDGDRWTALTRAPLAETPFGLTAPEPGLLFAGFRNGEIWASEDAGETFGTLCRGPARIRRLAAVADQRR